MKPLKRSIFLLTYLPLGFISIFAVIAKIIFILAFSIFMLICMGIEYVFRGDKMSWVQNMYECINDFLNYVIDWPINQIDKIKNWAEK